MKDYITNTSHCQAPNFADKEVSSSFAPRKKRSQNVAKCLDVIGLEKRYNRMFACGDVLTFKTSVDSDGIVSDKMHLARAMFCRDRLCPMCQWRRSMKTHYNVSRVLKVTGDKYRYLFLTLTIPNCSGTALSVTLDKLFESWHRYINQKWWKSVVKGFFRTVEITFNHEKQTYHPHIHCLIVVEKEYFRSDAYRKHKDWQEAWMLANGSTKRLQVNIKPVTYTSNGSALSDDQKRIQALYKALCEISKYQIKDTDIGTYFNQSTIGLVQTLASALHGRRLYQMGGVFKSIWKDLRLSDAEDSNADLLHIDENDVIPTVQELFVTYKWCGNSYSAIYDSTLK